VTAFGIFLTPVFFYVIQWVTDRRATALPEADGEGIAVGGIGAGDNADGVMLPHGPGTRGSGHEH